MTNEEITRELITLKKEITELKNIFEHNRFHSTEVINKLQKYSDGINIDFGTGVGTQIGTSALQKIGFWGKTPVVRPAAISEPTAPGATYNQTEAGSMWDAIITIIDDLNSMGLTS